MLSCPRLLEPSPRSVLVFRASRLGDLLCAVPALRALRAALPAAQICLVGMPWAAQFARRFPRYVDEFLPFPGDPLLPEQKVDEAQLASFYASVRMRQADLALNLHGSGPASTQVVSRFGARRYAGFSLPDAAPWPDWDTLPWPASGSEVERLLQLCDWLGAPRQGSHLEYPLYADDRAELEASGLGAGLISAQYVCLHAGASRVDKCWPPACFAAVGDTIARQYGLDVVLTGSANEVGLAQDVARRMRAPARVAAGDLSVGAMAVLLAGARLVVCNDTGVSHLAAALAVPSVVIFSQADPLRWAPADTARHICLAHPGGVAVDDVMAPVARLVDQAQALRA